MYVYAVRSGRSVMAMIGSERFQISFLTEEEAVEVYKKVYAFKNNPNPSEEEILNTKALFDPNVKFNMDACGILEKDVSGNVYLKGYNIPMPRKMVSMIMEALELGLPTKHLENFWKLCMMNPVDHPNGRPRDMLFDFANQYGFPITDKGYFIAYKSVAWKGTQNLDKALKISQTYLDVVANNKSKPTEWTVIEMLVDNQSFVDVIKNDDLEDWLKTGYEGLALSKTKGMLENMAHLYIECNNLRSAFEFSKGKLFLGSGSSEATTKETETWEYPETGEIYTIRFQEVCLGDTIVDKEAEEIYDAPEEEVGDLKWVVVEDSQENTIENIVGTSEELYFALREGFTLPTKEELIDRVKAKYPYKNLGNLQEAFEGISKMFEIGEEVFTDWHTKTMNIRLGIPVSMPIENCDCNPNQTCSSGLHVGAPEYVRTFGHGSKQYVLAVLVNPAKVVAIPVDYSFTKMRVSEYMPYAIVELEEDGIKEIKSPYFENDYSNYEKEELEKAISKYTGKNPEYVSLCQSRLVDISLT